MLLPRGNLNCILSGGQVADNTRTGRIEVGCPQAAANKLDGDRFSLLVAEGEDGVGGFAIDQLDSKDLRVREGGGDSNIQVGRGSWSIDFFGWDLSAVSACLL